VDWSQFVEARSTVGEIGGSERCCVVNSRGRYCVVACGKRLCEIVLIVAEVGGAPRDASVIINRPL
jgi:hypothetical protein